jgi:hypothetical protein
MLLSLSLSSCLATIFVDGMGFVVLPPLRHLSPVPSHDGRQYRPHARLRMVVGRRGAQAEGGYQEVWRMGRGEIWVQQKWVFYQRVVHTNTHNFEAKKTQGKNRVMQRHGQVFPPCRCIARITAGEYICRRFLRNWRGGGNQQNWQGSAPPLPKIVFLFLGFVFESAGSSLEKKKKK